MSNLATLTQKIVTRTRAMLEQDEIWVAIIDSINFHRHRRRPFNTKSFSFALSPNVARYSPGDGLNSTHSGIPQGFDGPLGAWQYQLPGSSEKRKLPNITREVRHDVESYEASSISGRYLEGFSVIGRDVVVAPPPTQAGLSVHGECRIFFPAPEAVYDEEDESWSFRTPDGGTQLSGKWTNPWIEHEEALIRLKAVALLAEGILGDEALGRAALTEWLQIIGEDEVGVNLRRGRVGVKPWLGGSVY